MINESVKLIQECLDYANLAGVSVTSVSCNDEVFSVDFYDSANALSVHLYRYEDGWYTLAKQQVWKFTVSCTVVQFDTLARAMQESTSHLLVLRKRQLNLSEAKTLLK